MYVPSRALGQRFQTASPIAVIQAAQSFDSKESSEEQDGQCIHSGLAESPRMLVIERKCKTNESLKSESHPRVDANGSQTAENGIGDKSDDWLHTEMQEWRITSVFDSAHKTKMMLSASQN